MRLPALIIFVATSLAGSGSTADEAQGRQFFERHIRPILIAHCYECHSEEAQTREGGLLLDRESGWLEGGDSGKAVLPGDASGSLLLQAVTHKSNDLQMPPDEKLSDRQISLLKRWIQTGAVGPASDLGTTEFSQLGDQKYLFEQAKDHWAFKDINKPTLPQVSDDLWNIRAIDRFVFQRLESQGLTPSRQATDRTLIRRLYFDLTGLPPTLSDIKHFVAAASKNRRTAIEHVVDRLIDSQDFGVHVGRLWLDVARYADTDSAYRPDTKTPYYFPFAFTYRDYVVDSFNNDKPFDQFIKEQLAADLMGFEPSAPETAALGYLATGPYANRNQSESVDDWIDVTTRGLMGITVACARCHDHKYEPVPTTDYYALHGVFSSVRRIDELDEKNLPTPKHYSIDAAEQAEYQKLRATIDKEIKDAGGKKSGGNNRPVSVKIRDTKLAKLLLFHRGGPVHAMVVKEAKPVSSFVAIRGDTSNRGEQIPRRFLKVLDEEQSPFPADNSGRLALAEKIASPDNPLTARVFVNRIWGLLIGSHLVSTPSNFGLRGSPPTHPDLLDWLTADFIENGWSTKHLVKTIATSRTYQQRSESRTDAAANDPQNSLLWRANRKYLSIEAIRDSMLAVAEQLDRRTGGRAAPLWEEDYTRRRAVYGYINRFNLDPTLRAYDFPARMQTHSHRGESIVAPQALFAMNSQFAIDQSVAITQLSTFRSAATDKERIAAVFEAVLQRPPVEIEYTRIERFVELQSRLFTAPRRNSKVTSPWPLVAQSLMMSNEFQYVD